MKILMLIDQIGAGVGGGERMAIGLARELARRGERVTLCVTRGGSDADAADLEGSGVEVVRLERRSAADVRAFRPLLRLIRERGFDVLHAHKFGSNVWGTLFGRICRVPVVIAQEQTWSYEGKPLRKLIDGGIGRLADAFVAVSSRDRERMVSREKVPREKVVMIPNAVVPREEDGLGDLRAELGIADDELVVGTAAQLRPQKALHVLVEAFSLLSEGRPRARLVIAGDGECRAELEAQAARLGLAERTRFIGNREDIGTVLAGFDVAVMSSDYEGTPLFAAECMAAGTPLVATDVGGLPDLVDDGTSGLLVPPRNPPALADAIGRMLDDPGLRSRIAEAARERSEQFGMERTGERFLELYAELLEGSRRR